MTEREESLISSVRSAGSVASSARLSHPSSNGLAAVLSNRTGGLTVAPRPGRAAEGMLTVGAGSGRSWVRPAQEDAKPGVHPWRCSCSVRR